MKLRELFENTGRIVKGVNTTPDVGVDQVSKEAAKFGFKVDKDGVPPTLSKKVKGKSTNVLFNLGLTESVSKDELKKQLAMGVKVEMEHTDDPKEALKIAMDHLREDPLYYDKLKFIESSNLSEGIYKHILNLADELSFKDFIAWLEKNFVGGEWRKDSTVTDLVKQKYGKDVTIKKPTTNNYGSFENEVENLTRYFINKQGMSPEAARNNAFGMLKQKYNK